MDGLAEKWDNDAKVRERLRDGNHLMQCWNSTLLQGTNEFVGHSVDNIKVNSFILSPVFKMMSQQPDRASPSINGILEQIGELFRRAKVTFSKHSDRIYQDGWAIRRLCTYAKAQKFRDGPPKESIMRDDKKCCLWPRALVATTETKDPKQSSIKMISLYMYIYFYVCIYINTFIQSCTPYMGRLWWLHTPQPLLLSLEDPVLLGLMHDLGFTDQELGQLKVSLK